MGDDITLISDPRVAAVPVVECGEPLLDARGRFLVDTRMADAAGAYAHLRAGLFERLDRAERLLPDGYRLLIFEGYRPIPTQQEVFDSYAATLRATYPGLSLAEIEIAASRHVSPVAVAPHTAGAAVDLTLSDPDGNEYDLGTPLNATPEQSDGACYTAADAIPAAARRHRELLAAALESAGLVNYPTEWWHWSFGDRYWALTTGAPHAHYGPTTLSEKV